MPPRRNSKTEVADTPPRTESAGKTATTVMSEDQQLLVREAFAAEISVLTDDQKKEFESRLRNHPYDYNGINQIIGPFFQIPEIFEDDNPEQLKDHLNAYKNASEKRQLLRKYLAPEIQRFLPNFSKRTFLLDSNLETVALINEQLGQLQYGLKLPTSLQPNDIISPRDLEDSLKKFRAQQTRHETLIQHIKDLSDLFERIPKVLYTEIEYLTKIAKKLPVGDPHATLLQDLLPAYQAYADHMQHAYENIIKPEHFTGSLEDLEYIDKIVKALSSIPDDTYAKCSLFFDEISKLTQLLSKSEFLTSDEKSILASYHHKAPIALAYQAPSRIQLPFTDIIKYSDIEKDENTLEYPAPYNTILSNINEMNERFLDATSKQKERYANQQIDDIEQFNNERLKKVLAEKRSQLPDGKFYTPGVLRQFYLAQLNKFNKILISDTYSDEIRQKLEKLFGITLSPQQAEEIYYATPDRQKTLYDQLTDKEMAKDHQESGVIITPAHVAALNIHQQQTAPIISMTSAQRKIVNKAFQIEFQHSEHQSEFLEALHNQPFTYDGINAALRTLAPTTHPELAPQLPSSLEKADADGLTQSLKTIQSNQEKRILIRQAFSAEINQAEPNKIKQFEKELVAVSDASSSIEKCIQVLNPGFKLPELLTNQNINKYLKQFPLRTSLRQKVSPELNAANQDAFEKALHDSVELNRDNVNKILQTLGGEPVLQLPEATTLEDAINSLPGLSRAEQQKIRVAVKKEIADADSQAQDAFEKALANPTASFTTKGVNIVLHALNPALEIRLNENATKENIQTKLVKISQEHLTQKQKTAFFRALGPLLAQQALELRSDNEYKGFVDYIENALSYRYAEFSAQYFNVAILMHYFSDQNNGQLPPHIKLLDAKKIHTDSDLYVALELFKASVITPNQKKLLNEKFESELCGNNQSKFGNALEIESFTPEGLTAIVATLGNPPFYGLKYKFDKEDSNNLAQVVSQLQLPGIKREYRELIREQVDSLLKSDQYKFSIDFFNNSLDSPKAEFTKEYINSILEALEPSLVLPKPKNDTEAALIDSVKKLPEQIQKLEEKRQAEIEKQKKKDEKTIEAQQRHKAKSFSGGKKPTIQKPETRKRADSAPPKFETPSSENKFDELVGKPAKAKPSKTKEKKSTNVPEPPYRKNESKLSSTSKIASFNREGFIKAIEAELPSQKGDKSDFAKYSVQDHHHLITTKDHKVITFEEETCLFRVDTSTLSDEALFAHFIAIGKLAIAGNLKSMDVKKVRNPNSQRIAVLALKKLGLEVTGYDPNMEALPTDEAIVDKFTKDHPKLQHDLKELQQLGKKHSPTMIRNA